MAIVHRATITPTKLELVEQWLDRQPWGGTGELEMLGGYRFDDPAGEVGVEGLLVRRDDRVLHVPLTYRGAPLDDADEHLVSTMDHSVLGERWVYEAQADPVALGCFARALAGEQEQAVVEVWEGDRLVERRVPDVTVLAEDGAAMTAAADDVATAQHDGTRLLVARVLGGHGPAGLDGVRRLTVTWPGGRGVVVALG